MHRTCDSDHTLPGGRDFGIYRNLMRGRWFKSSQTWGMLALIRHGHLLLFSRHDLIPKVSCLKHLLSLCSFMLLLPGRRKLSSTAWLNFCGTFGLINQCQHMIGNRRDRGGHLHWVQRLTLFVRNQRDFPATSLNVLSCNRLVMLRRTPWLWFFVDRNYFFEKVLKKLSLVLLGLLEILFLVNLKSGNHRSLS